MSLNGLDDAAVTEAYTSALGEAGGWFLIKYASRDSVEMLTRGTGGATEVRAAIQGYEEKSPLYGFLLYRRRKVLIKYVPEGTSRLLQARVAVHFTAITDKFTPHDTTFSIATADELSDAALTSACSLHTAAPSSSSSSLSSRKQKLDEITEDAEDGQSTAGASESASMARPFTAETVTANIPEVVKRLVADEHGKRTLSEDEQGQAVAGAEGSPETSLDPIPEGSDLLRTHTAPGPDSFKKYDALFENGPDPRLSSQTVRPELADLYAEIYAQYNKPKVKLGPRPKASLDIRRPSTSGDSTQSVARPVSSLPAGLRASNRRNVDPKRPKSRDTRTVPSIAVPPPPPIPAALDIPTSPSHVPKSPASIRSLPMNAYSSLQHKSAGVTPEKQRLMKAIQLRKKQMEARKLREEEERKMESANHVTQAGVEESAQHAKVVDDVDTNTSTPKAEVGSANASMPADAPNETRQDEAPAENKTSDVDETNAAIAHEGDEVGLPPTRAETEDMHSAASASSPTSAQTQGSSVAASTRPSSLSEDEVHPEEDKNQSIAISPVDTDAASPYDQTPSAESTSTVVPESTTPIPLVEVSEQGNEIPAPAIEDNLPEDQTARKKKRGSLVLKSPIELEEARARRRSKRQSMMLSLPPDGLQDAGTGTSGGKEDRRIRIDPSHLSAENSEADYLSDDSFMEELQSAKFEEAMPVSVSKSPIIPYFPRKPSNTEIVVPKRSASQQNPGLGSASPEPSGPRKLSGPWLTHSNTDSVIVTKKINVGSGISQRIKALAEKSSRDSAASLTPTLTADGGASIVAQRKSSFFPTPRDGNSPTFVNRISRASFINVSRSTTPEPKQPVQAAPVITPTKAAKQPTVYNVQQEPEQPESVQVTARIVRDPQPQAPALVMPIETSPLELYQSSITIDHQKSTRPPTSSSRHSPIKTEPTSPRPPSSAQSIEPTANLPQSSSESSWRSFGRRMSESKNAGPPRSMSVHSFDISSSDEKSAKKEQKDSRASKLFKRMSSITSITRKNSAPSSPEDIPSVPLESVREPPSAVQIGDLNIQFPDTLLWKRRWVEIDASGSLIMNLSQSNKQSKGITRRFNLNEFRAPYIPDQDCQELPNSIVMDFLDGRSLQMACETFNGQGQVLAVLRDAHKAWTDYNQGS